MNADAALCVSVISHGHGAEVRPLLDRLAALPPAPGLRLHRVVLTLNTPEPELAQSLRARTDWPFALTLIENPAPLGFGANHNQAFARDAQQAGGGGGGCDFFAVLNPDISWPAGHHPLAALHHALQAAGPRAGLAWPQQTDAQGRPQDHERLLPTPARLLRRYTPGLRAPEVPAGAAPHWVNAACLLLRRQAYAAVGGFDEGYHMYCEDVDLCLRLQNAGWRLVRADAATVVHGARRASRRDPRHFLWHVQSLWRLWHSPAWRQWHARPHPEPKA